MTQILDGLAVSTQIRSEIKEYLATRSLLRTPCLAVVLCSDDEASQVYVKRKREACKEVGINSLLLRPFEDPIESYSDPEQHLLSMIDWLNEDTSVHGILVQLPLPPMLNAHAVFDRIHPLKDVDVFSPTNVGLLLQGRPRLIPCTPHGIQELLSRSGISLDGKTVAVINRSDIVGKPLSALLIQNDGGRANATVVMCHDHTPPETLKEICRTVDVIVVAVGKPNFITPDMVTERSIVVDVGINRSYDTGKICGDVDKACYEKVAAYSPVPGGVGPMTVTMLLRNTVQSQELLVYGSGKLPYNPLANK